MVSKRDSDSIILNALGVSRKELWDVVPLEELVGRPRVLKFLTKTLASKIVERKDNYSIEFDFIAGRAPNGMVVGWQLREDLSQMMGRELPFVYVREAKKKGGHQERITGDRNNPLIQPGQRVLLVDIDGDVGSLYKRRDDSIVVLTENNKYQFAGLASLMCNSDEKTVGVLSGFSSVEQPQPGEVPYEISKININPATLEEIGTKILKPGAMEIRDVPFGGKESGGQDPFLYSSSNKGPGYLMIKGLVGQPEIMKYLCQQIALKVAEKEFDFVAGNVTGGVIPGWGIREYLEQIQGREIPYVFVKGTRADLSKMNDEEIRNLIVGHKNNPLIEPGMKPLIVEELVNFAETTSASAGVLRKAGYEPQEATTIFFYDHAQGHANLERAGLNMTALITLPEMLDVAERTGAYSSEVVQSYRNFLTNPTVWQFERGFVPPEKDIKKYFGDNYKTFMKKCSEMAKEMGGNKK